MPWFHLFLFFSFWFVESELQNPIFQCSYEFQNLHLDWISTAKWTQKYLLFSVPHHSRSYRGIANSESPSDLHSDPPLSPSLSAPLYFQTGNSLVFIINSSMEVLLCYSRKFHPISLMTVFKASNSSWLCCILNKCH